MWDHKKLMLIRFSSYGFLKNLRFFEPFLYLFFLANGLSFFQIGILIGIREFSVFILEIPSGIIADLTGRRRAMATAFASYLVSFSIFYIFRSFLIFVPAMFLFAVGESLRSGTHKSMIMEHLDIEGMEDEKVEYYGKTRSASRLGSAVAAVLAGVIVFMFQNYNVVFLVTLLPYSLAFILMLTYPKELDGDITGKTTLEDMWEHTTESFRQLYENLKLLRMVINASLYDSFFKISKDYLSPIVEGFAITMPLLLFIENSTQRTAIMVGIVYFFVYLNSFVSSLKSSALMEKIGDMGRALNILYFILAGAFFIVAVFLHIDIVLLSIIGFFFFFTLYNLRKPMVVGFLSDNIEPQKRATLLSTHKQFRSIIGMVIAPILGFLATYSISYAFAFGGLVLLTVAVLLPIKTED
ncbi:MAG: MFS transporter [Candidatus Thermoplasmatota archaeon]|nr:MFS transporter [Candidatus Thermoplasmatota archaeon]